MAAVSFTAVLATLSSPSANADPSSSLEVIRADLNEAELIDLGRMAKQDGITLDEAILSFGWHQPFAQLADEIARQHPKQFVGARITDSPGRRAWIGFKGHVPTAAAAQMASFAKADVEGRGNLGYSAKDLDQLVIAAQQSVLARKDLVKTATSSYDIATGLVTVEVEPVQAQAATDPLLKESLRKALLDGLPDSVRAGPVEVQIRSALTSEPEFNAFASGRMDWG